MLKIGAALFTSVWLFVGAASAQEGERPLRSLSQHDFFRVFGTTPSDVVGAGAQADNARAASERRWTQRLGAMDDMLAAAVEKGEVADGTLTNSTALLTLLQRRNDPMSYLYLWHLVALDTTAVDHAPTGPGILHQQVGPARSARALAMVHQAMFEVANSLTGMPFGST